MEAVFSSLQLSQLGLEHSVYRFQKHHLPSSCMQDIHWRDSWKGAAASQVIDPDQAGEHIECTEASSWCSKSYEGRQVVRADHDPLRKIDPIECPIFSLRFLPLCAWLTCSIYSTVMWLHRICLLAMEMCCCDRIRFMPNRYPNHCLNQF